MNENKTCFNCIHHDLCYKYKGVADATKYGFNIDGKDAPISWREIFQAVAGACLQFKHFKEENNSHE